MIPSSPEARGKITGAAPVITGTRAARVFNVQKRETVRPRNFSRLRDTQVALDTNSDFITEIGKVPGILLHMAATA